MKIKNISLIILATLLSSNSFANTPRTESKKKMTWESFKNTSKKAALKIKYGAKEIVLPLSTAFVQAGLAVVIGGLSITAVKNLLSIPWPVENDKSPAGFFFKELNQKTIQGLVSILLVLSYAYATGNWTIEESTEQAVDSALLGSRQAATNDENSAPDMSAGCAGPCCC